MERQVMIGVLLIVLTVALDWFELEILAWHQIGMRAGVVLMLTAGQLLLASTPVGSGLHKALTVTSGWLGMLIRWAINLILTGLNSGGQLSRAVGEGIGDAIVIGTCTYVILKIGLGFWTSKTKIGSTKKLDWMWVYMAVLIPVLIFGLPIFAKGAATDLNHTVTSWIYHNANSKV